VQAAAAENQPANQAHGHVSGGMRPGPLVCRNRGFAQTWLGDCRVHTEQFRAKQGLSKLGPSPKVEVQVKHWVPGTRPTQRFSPGRAYRRRLKAGRQEVALVCLGFGHALPASTTIIIAIKPPNRPTKAIAIRRRPCRAFGTC
jgi:hypothetical protein